MGVGVGRRGGGGVDGYGLICECALRVGVSVGVFFTGNVQ